MTEEQAKYELEKKGPINVDISQGILPKSYNELLQFAALYKDSGLAPKSFTSTQQLAIAIGMCLELDRPILTGIQDMAVINGKVSIYGDAALAIVRRSGLLEYIKEREEGEPYADSWKFTCEIKRKDAPESRVGVWTWPDAKRAGFDDPKMRDGGKDIYSPWRRFTRRMMQFKARNFPLRDEFGDVIKGMTLAEDAQDIIDVTPPARTIKVEGDTKPKEGDIYEAVTLPGPQEEESYTEFEPSETISVPAETMDEKALYREEWVNLRTAGYSTYLYKNFSRVEANGKRWPDLYAEQKEKWAKLYNEPWPLVEKVQAQAQDEPQETNMEEPSDEEQIAAQTMEIMEGIPKNDRGVIPSWEMSKLCKAYVKVLPADVYRRIMKDKDSTDIKEGDRKLILSELIEASYWHLKGKQE